MSDAGSSLTFFQKSPIECPVCESKIYREELRTGRGRLIAGSLTDELRRNYEPSKKYGEVHPLIYAVTVCPTCYYAVLSSDFDRVPDSVRPALQAESQSRIESIAPLFPSLVFSEARGLKAGAAAYFLAMMCYDHFPKEFAPSFKQGLCALRAAWLCSDLHRKEPNENYDYLASLSYRKARFFYDVSIRNEQSGKENLGSAGHLGPDLDKNYGYDGVLYLTGLLELKYGPRKDAEKRREALTRVKRTVARIFGMGRASKDKPTAILDNARDVYEQISRELGDDSSDPESGDESP